jgi:oxalyl-CoA decarboxylase
MSSDQKSFEHVLRDLAYELGRSDKIGPIFGIAGDPITPLIGFAESQGIKYYGFRNEQAASYAASSISFLTRGKRLGVCLTVAGPGMVNALTGCANSLVNGWPMLLICPFTPSENEFQYTNQLEAIKGLCKDFVFYENGSESVAHAIALACESPYGSVVLFVPKKPSYSHHLSKPISQGFLTGSVEIPPKSNVIIIVGSQIVFRPDVDAVVRKIVETNGIPFIAESMARGILEESHQLCVTSARSAAFRSASVAILVGTKLDWMLAHGRSPKWNDSCQFIIYSDSWSKTHSSEKVSLQSLSKLSQLAHVIINESWREELLNLARSKRSELTARITLWRRGTLPSHFEAIGAIKLAITKAELRNALVVSEGANTMDVARIGLDDITEPCKRLDAGRWGTMGSGLGFVIAACALNPQQPVICIQGDSAFGFSGMELETIVRYRCNAIVVIFNNGGIYTGAKDNATAFSEGIRYTLLMEAFGGSGLTTEGRDANGVLDVMMKAVHMLKTGKYPVFVDIIIDPASGALSGSLSRL